MTRYQPGDDVVVKFGGRKHRGEVIRQHSGYVMCLINIDPLWDYGSIGPRLDPQPTVCVKESDVRHADDTTTL